MAALAREIRWRCAALVMLGLLLASAVGAVPARAQQSIMIDGARPELHVGVGWGGEIGLGARVDIPIVSSGFIHGVDDEFALSPGVEFAFGGGGGGQLSFGGLVTAQWNFYLHARWSVFPELGLALIYRERDRSGERDDSDLLVRPVFGVGGRFHLNRRNALVLRFAWPFGVQLGITF